MNEILKRVLQLKDNLHVFIDTGFHDDVLSNDEYIKERFFLIEKYKTKTPEVIKNCRTISDFINQLRLVASGSGSWQSRREYIEHEFKDFLNFLEFGENENIATYDESTFSNDTISIILQKDVFEHVKSLLKSEHYYSAVEESYKIVRDKLKLIT